MFSFAIQPPPPEKVVKLRQLSLLGGVLLRQQKAKQNKTKDFLKRQKGKKKGKKGH